MSRKNKIQIKKFCISTHSLTRRLTCYRKCFNFLFIISTHSLTRRLTSILFDLNTFLIISTHSLTRRLTMHYIKSLFYHFYFNSQPHEEADACRFHQVGRYSYFNSQPHEEADARFQVLFQLIYISTHSLARRLTYSFVFFGKSSVFQLTASRGG